MGVLYMLEFVNGKKYIGLTEYENPLHRFWQHRHSAKYKSTPLYNAWKKHGEPKMFVLAIDLFGIELANAEIEAIKKHKTLHPHGYNLLEGGQISPSRNDVVKKKISDAQIKRYMDPEERKKASIVTKNRSKETRKKISLALTGKKLSEETKQKLREANLGKKHNSLTKEKMSKTHTGKKYSEETLQRMREAAQKRMKSPQAQAQLKAASLKGGNSMKLKAKRKL
jgi:hypothetical protein